MTRIAIVFALALMASACGGRLVDVDLFVVSEQTALERQVLGSYRALGSDLAAYSSVRGVEPDGTLKIPPPATASQAASMRALQELAYNRDDVDEMLVAGVIGEGRNGLLVAQNVPLPPVGRITADLVARVVEEENASRQVLITRLMATVPGVREEQRAEVEWIFATMNRDTAPTGSPVQNRDGTWSTK